MNLPKLLATWSSWHLWSRNIKEPYRDACIMNPHWLYNWHVANARNSLILTDGMLQAQPADSGISYITWAVLTGIPDKRPVGWSKYSWTLSPASYKQYFLFSYAISWAACFHLPSINALSAGLKPESSAFTCFCLLVTLLLNQKDDSRVWQVTTGNDVTLTVAQTASSVICTRWCFMSPSKTL